MAILRTVFGNRLRELRLKRGLSQKQLAHLLDVHNSYVHQMEKGKVAFRAESLEKIATVLGVRPYELLLEEEDQLFFWKNKNYTNLGEFITDILAERELKIDQLIKENLSLKEKLGNSLLE